MVCNCRSEKSHERLKIGVPCESVALAQPNGWMNTEFFLKWLKHFINFSKTTKEKPELLILDGHSSHKDLAAISYAKENHVHMLQHPATHDPQTAALR